MLNRDILGLRFYIILLVCVFFLFVLNFSFLYAASIPISGCTTFSDANYGNTFVLTSNISGWSNSCFKLNDSNALASLEIDCNGKNITSGVLSDEMFSNNSKSLDSLIFRNCNISSTKNLFEVTDNNISQLNILDSNLTLSAGKTGLFYNFNLDTFDINLSGSKLSLSGSSSGFLFSDTNVSAINVVDLNISQHNASDPLFDLDDYSDINLFNVTFVNDVNIRNGPVIQFYNYSDFDLNVNFNNSKVVFTNTGDGIQFYNSSITNLLVSDLNVLSFSSTSSFIYYDGSDVNSLILSLPSGINLSNGYLMQFTSGSVDDDLNVDFIGSGQVSLSNLAYGVVFNGANVGHIVLKNIDLNFNASATSMFDFVVNSDVNRIAFEDSNLMFGNGLNFVNLTQGYDPNNFLQFSFLDVNADVLRFNGLDLNFDINNEGLIELNGTGNDINGIEVVGSDLNIVSGGLLELGNGAVVQDLNLYAPQGIGFGERAGAILLNGDANVGFSDFDVGGSEYWCFFCVSGVEDKNVTVDFNQMEFVRSESLFGVSEYSGNLQISVARDLNLEGKSFVSVWDSNDFNLNIHNQRLIDVNALLRIENSRGIITINDNNLEYMYLLDLNADTNVSFYNNYLIDLNSSVSDLIISADINLLEVSVDFNTMLSSNKSVLNDDGKSGGNYWNRVDNNGYSVTCTDTNEPRGICDSALLLYIGVDRNLYDYLPLRRYTVPTPPSGSGGGGGSGGGSSGGSGGSSSGSSSGNKVIEIQKIIEKVEKDKKKEIEPELKNFGKDFEELDKNDSYSITMPSTVYVGETVTILITSSNEPLKEFDFNINTRTVRTNQDGIYKAIFSKAGDYNISGMYPDDTLFSKQLKVLEKKSIINSIENVVNRLPLWFYIVAIILVLLSIGVTLYEYFKNDKNNLYYK